MSTLAFITVMDCDNCKRVAVAKGLAEHDTLEAVWYVGLLLQLCGECRIRPEFRERIREDRRYTLRAHGKAAEEVNDRYNGRHEYVN